MAQFNQFVGVAVAALAMAVVVTVWAMFRSAHAAPGSDAASLLIVAWAISPYIAVLLAGLLFGRFTRIPYRSVTFCVVSVLMLAFTIAAYASLFNGSSSTTYIAFYAVPMDLLVGGSILMSVGLTLAWALDRRASRSTQ